MPDLNLRIRDFYDSSSDLWEQVWGEHMHHGYYANGESSRKDRRLAQIDLIEKLLEWAKPQIPTSVLDVGCGIGGSSLYLADKYLANNANNLAFGTDGGFKVTGISLSPVQANRATERSRALGLQARSQFLVADAMSMPFADGSFDLVWSLESGEHMPDKEKFLQECYRVLKPGGTFIFATWCHRDISDRPLNKHEQRHLQRIYDVYCLPYTISLSEYKAIAHRTNFQNIKTADWSQAVAPFWDVVIDSAISPSAILGVLRSGLSTVTAALSLRQMSRGYADGLIKFGLLTATK
ncbi:MAG: methyltransferase domain-containing protein [Pseudanabaena sp. RU_4_16]|nr:methyltransferase domain-containing protein [Pseudanabaena sp. SU_2_4]NJM27373.1 methyltransferase domain-containing protein [Pseudanabaena sp. RU_4_16]